LEDLLDIHPSKASSKPIIGLGEYLLLKLIVATSLSFILSLTGEKAV